jgi:hypothetical protein
LKIALLELAAGICGSCDGADFDGQVNLDDRHYVCDFALLARAQGLLHAQLCFRYGLTSPILRAISWRLLIPWRPKKLLHPQKV